MPPHFPVEARSGRDQQRYNEHSVRQVAGCVPIDPKTRRILLISSRKHEGSWVLPKGGWESDETQEEAAARETFEEAGVYGNITRFVCTVQDYMPSGLAKTQFWFHELEIQGVLESWPEKHQRERRWFTYDEAVQVLGRKPFLQQVIQQCSLAPVNDKTH